MASASAGAFLFLGKRGVGGKGRASCGPPFSETRRERRGEAPGGCGAKGRPWAERVGARGSRAFYPFKKEDFGSLMGEVEARGSRPGAMSLLLKAQKMLGARCPKLDTTSRNPARRGALGRRVREADPDSRSEAEGLGRAEGPMRGPGEGGVIWWTTAK